MAKNAKKFVQHGMMIGELTRALDGLKEVTLDSARRAKMAEESKNQQSRTGEFTTALFKLEERVTFLEADQKKSKSDRRTKNFGDSNGKKSEMPRFLQDFIARRKEKGDGDEVSDSFESEILNRVIQKAEKETVEVSSV